ncbi:MazG nucleotide pyrophosphohydrolase domain-containing protein [Leuconostoc suionicum]|uniref:MazG nucleotide pyrophosphohydrolase domain-containing protein n=1 Tax=Leuconostoc suionicum TaxID=1511761 RepID=UPI00374927DB
MQEHKMWLTSFYKKRNWFQYSTFIRLNFLFEEVGELAQCIRAIELGRDHPGEEIQNQSELNAHLKEELADVLDQVLILSEKYNIDLDNLIEQSQTKLKQRFN